MIFLSFLRSLKLIQRLTMAILFISLSGCGYTSSPSYRVHNYQSFLENDLISSVNKPFPTYTCNANYVGRDDNRSEVRLEYSNPQHGCHYYCDINPKGIIVGYAFQPHALDTCSMRDR